ncbi:MAG: protein kinase [Muribaculaceae bacterium]|nr:protein kinase [Muribaculaceae bacterium]
MSQFLNDDSQLSPDSRGEIDFDDAVRLPDGGSTCDIYRTKWQRRNVFVKRLKEQYRSNPLYLDALDKEFDIGVNLKHPSLPEYREFHRDFIVLDYIDGLTLAEMIKRQDPWLKSEKNIVKMLKELVDVVGYLHRHNVVHCDIKPDNIMITANGRNLVLIDFDKSYTDSLGDTSGHPGKYGLPIDEKGCMAIDFHGIAMVVEKLKSNIPGFKFSAYRRFVNACNKLDVSCEELIAILDYKPSKFHKKTKYIMIITIIIMCVAIYFSYNMAINRVSSESVVYADTIFTEHVSSEKITQESKSIIPSENKDNTLKTETSAVEIEYNSPDKLLEIAQKKAEILDSVIAPQFNELQASLDYLQKLKNDTTLSGQELLEAIRRQGDLEDDCLKEAILRAREMFNLDQDNELHERELARILSFSKSYTGYKRRYAREGREYRLEYERRLEKEGKRLEDLD